MKRAGASLFLVMVAAAACSEGTVVEVDPVPADYTDWYRVDAVGEVPGHGDTYRIIYANDLALLRGQTTTSPTDPDRLIRYDTYPEGTILVKEIYQRDGDQPGALKYLGVMRMLDDDEAPSGAELHKLTGSIAWLFTYLADDIDSPEEYRSSCWNECHIAAPMDGAFLDYGQ